MGVFGEFISKKRQELGMSLRGFAKELGKAPSYVSDIEKGNREPNEKTLLEKIKELENKEKEIN